jgi:hypothetical protein
MAGNRRSDKMVYTSCDNRRVRCDNVHLWNEEHDDTNLTNSKNCEWKITTSLPLPIPCLNLLNLPDFLVSETESRVLSRLTVTNSFLSSPGILLFLHQTHYIYIDDLIVDIVFELWRYVDQGKGILQPHKLIDELESIHGEGQATEDLKNGPFGQIIKSAQVN